MVILGCGRVGAGLARSLADRDHSVAIIDKDPSAFQRLGPDFDQITVRGNGFDREVLAKAGVGRADAFVAVSSGDNSNIIATRVAREHFGVENVVARIYDSKRALVFERLGIPTIATVRWTADRLLRQLLPEEQGPVWRDPSATLSLVELSFHEDWIGLPIADLEAATGHRVSYIQRFGKATLPTQSMMLQDGDKVFLFVGDYDAAHVEAIAQQSPRTKGGES
nr:TrkA family potassium uptake protein [Haloglycomyces albus]